MASSHPARFHLPDRELSWRFSRSSGPGGQHVNTTDTRVELLWSLDESTVLSDTQKRHLTDRLRSHLIDGTITVVSSQYRSQHRNREAARIRLEELIAKALIPPKPRRATKPSKGATQRRLDEKKRRSDLKQSRRPGWD